MTMNEIENIYIAVDITNNIYVHYQTGKPKFISLVKICCFYTTDLV